MPCAQQAAATGQRAAAQDQGALAGILCAADMRAPHEHGDRQFRLGPLEEANCSHSQYDACPLALGPGGASAKVEWSGNDGR